MKKPYILEPKLQGRVIQFVNNTPDADLEETVDHVMTTYKEYRRKQKKPFLASVQKAYDWALYQRSLDYDDIDIDDDDGGGSDIELLEPEYEPKLPSMNTVLTNMYKKNSSMASPQNKCLSNGGTVINRLETPPQESIKKKRKMNESFSAPSKLKKSKKLVKVEQPESIEPLVTSTQMDNAYMLAYAALNCPEDEFLSTFKIMLVTGYAGSGKTTFIRSIAGKAKSSLISISASCLVNDTDLKLQDIVEEALAVAPCILHIHKIDHITASDVAKAPEKKFLAQLLETIEDISFHHARSALVVMVECSKPELLSHELRDAFQDEIFMPVPNHNDRLNILKTLGKEISLADDDWQYLAQSTLSYAIKDIESLVKKAKYLQISRLLKDMKGSNTKMDTFLKQESTHKKDLVTPTIEQFKEALKDIVPTLKKEMFPTIPEVNMDDVGSLEDVKSSMHELIISPILHKEQYERFREVRPSGVLMWGPPGCGKTLMAQAIANSSGLNFLPVSGPQILNMYQGESERAVRNIFEKARSVAPCVIFFDEFDSICPTRSKHESGSKTTVVNTLLVEMNGITQRKDVYVIAATNRPDMLDPAIMRPGRFDKTLYVGLPDFNGRISILNAVTKNRTRPKISDDVDFSEISKECVNFSGSDVDALVSEAIRNAVSEINSDLDYQNNKTILKNELTMNNFRNALQKIEPSISNEQKHHYEKMRKKMQRSKGITEVTESNTPSSIVVK